MRHIGQAGEGASFIRWAEGLRAAAAALAQVADRYRNMSRQATSVHPLNSRLRESLHQASDRLTVLAALAGGWHRMARQLNPDDFDAYFNPRDGSLAKERRSDVAAATGYRPRHGEDDPVPPIQPPPVPAAERVGPWPRDPHTGLITGCLGRHGGRFQEDPTVVRFEPVFRTGDTKPFEYRGFCRFCGERVHGSGCLAPEMIRREALRAHARSGRPWKYRDAARSQGTVLSGMEEPPTVVRAGQRREVNPRNDNRHGRSRSRIAQLGAKGGTSVGVTGRYDPVAGFGPDEPVTRRRRIRTAPRRRRHHRTE